MQASRQIRVLAGLLAALVLLLTLWLWLRTTPAHNTEDTSPERITVYQAPAEALDIAIENSFGSYNIVLTYSESASAYRVAQLGADVPLYTGRLSYLGENATALEALARYSSPGDLAQYGLDTPAAQAVISFADGTCTTLYIGALSPDEESVYLRAQGNHLLSDPQDVYRVPLDSIDHILLGATDLISPLVTGAYPAAGFFETALLSGSLREQPIVVARGDDGSYTVNGRAIHPVGGLALVLTAYGITADQAVAVHPTETMLDAYGLLAPYSAIRLEDSEEVLELWASQPDGEDMCYLYRVGNPVVYRLPAERLRWLELDAFTLSDPAFIRPIPTLEELTALHITIEGDMLYTLAFTQRQNADPDVTLNAAPLPIELLRPFYQTLLSPQATGYGQPSGATLTPLLDLTFVLQSGEALSFHLLRDEDGLVYGADEAGQPRFLLPPAWAEKVATDLQALQNGVPVTAWQQ